LELIWLSAATVLKRAGGIGEVLWDGSCAGKRGAGGFGHGAGGGINGNDVDLVGGIGCVGDIGKGAGAVDKELLGKEVLGEEEGAAGEIGRDALQIEAALQLAVPDDHETPLGIHCEAAAGGGVGLVLNTE